MLTMNDFDAKTAHDTAHARHDNDEWIRGARHGSVFILALRFESLEHREKKLCSGLSSE